MEKVEKWGKGGRLAFSVQRTADRGKIKSKKAKGKMTARTQELKKIYD